MQACLNNNANLRFSHVAIREKTRFFVSAVASLNKENRKTTLILFFSFSYFLMHLLHERRQDFNLLSLNLCTVV